MSDDPFLTIRLETLKAGLEFALDEAWWLDRLFLRPEGSSLKREGDQADVKEEDDDHLGNFFGEIRGRAQTQARRIDEVLGTNPSTAWGEYARLNRESAEILRECFDYFGGRILRDRRLDDDICTLADALVERWSKRLPYKAKAFPTFPTAQETLRMTFGRIIRLRLPGSIWVLPYVAHDYGHFLVNDQNQDPIKACKLRHIGQVMKDDREVAGLPTEQERREAADQLVEELFADIFGCFLLGPSYACTALTMKLDPGSRAGPRSAISIDAKRAWAILLTIEWGVGALGDRKPEGLRDLLDWLWRRWEDSLGHSGMEPIAIDLYLEKVVREFIDGLSLKWYGYPYMNKSNSGWTTVDDWQKRLLNDETLNRVDGGTLADALNASWLARYHMVADDPGKTVRAQPAEQSQSPDGLKRLTKRALELYQAVRAFEVGGPKPDQGQDRMKAGTPSALRLPLDRIRSEGHG